jgi:hypothetical protein
MDVGDDIRLTTTPNRDLPHRNGVAVLRPAAS